MSRPIRRTIVLSGIVCLLALGGCDWFMSVDKRIASAEQRVAQGDDKGAVIDLQNALKAEPANTRARLMLAEISLRLGDPRSAQKEIEQAAQHGAAAEQTSALTAEVRLALREFKVLLTLLDSGKLALREPARSTYRGLALFGLGDLRGSADAFNAALSADPQWARARIGLAEVLAGQGDSAAGLEQLQKVLAAKPAQATASLLKGMILVQRGDYRTAAAALDASIKHGAGQLSGSQQVFALAALTEAQLALGDAKAAELTHAKLAGLAATSPLTRLLAARLAMSRQDYTNAVAQAQLALTAKPDLVAAKMLLGAAFLAQGKLNQAENQLSQVVAQMPENLEARKLLARVNLRMQRPDVAMQLLLPTQQAESSDPQTDALLGWANLQRGDDAAAIALLERSAAAQPENSNLKLDLAMAYLSGEQRGKAVELLESLPARAGDMRRESLLVEAIAATQGVAAARAHIDRVVAAAPKDPAVLNLAGTVYMRQGDLSRARTLLATALAADPGNSAVLTNQARLEMAAGDAVAAASALEKVLARNPTDMTARLMKAQILARTGDLVTASKRLEEIRVADPDALEPRLLLASLYLQQKKTQEADAVIREIRDRGNKEAPLAGAIGRLYLDAGRFEEALGWFRTAEQKDPTNSTYALSVARAQLALGNTPAAQETLHAILRADPGSIPASAALITLDLREGRGDAAKSKIAELKTLHPDDATVAILDGDIAMASRSYKEAADAYARAARLAPSGAVALRAYRANQLGGAPDAIAPLQAWLQRQPNDLAVRLALAEAYVKSGQRDRAVKEYEMLAGSERPHAMALNNLAWLYHENGDSRASQTAQRAYAAAPQVAAIADTYGWILVSGGDVQRGLPILQKAAAEAKSMPDIRYHYAAALAKAGRQDEARRELEAITRGEPKFASAADALKLLASLSPK
jgi:putative PEP-CTERM system TPR-repeat lipoprotein